MKNFLEYKVLLIVGWFRRDRRHALILHIAPGMSQRSSVFLAFVWKIFHCFVLALPKSICHVFQIFYTSLDQTLLGALCISQEVRSHLMQLLRNTLVPVRWWCLFLFTHRLTLWIKYSEASLRSEWEWFLLVHSLLLFSTENHLCSGKFDRLAHLIPLPARLNHNTSSDLHSHLFQFLLYKVTAEIFLDHDCLTIKLMLSLYQLYSLSC